MKCELCQSNEVVILKSDFDTRVKDFKNQKIVVENVNQFQCKACGETWISAQELQRIESEIERKKFEILSPNQIRLIRESLPISSKKGLSDFLCLNEKAFVKWEKGYTELNRANDLLIRLVARSKENFDFVQELHDKKFKFEMIDYYFLKGIVVREVKAEPVSNEIIWNKFFLNATPAVKVESLDMTAHNISEDEAA